MSIRRPSRLGRSENIALAITREYIQVLLQARIVQIADQNLGFHPQQGQGNHLWREGRHAHRCRSIQAEERLTAALAKRKQAEEDLSEAKIRFYTLVGKPLDSLTPLPNLSSFCRTVSRRRLVMPNRPTRRLRSAGPTSTLPMRRS
ncbi:MAG: hypothetical protein WDN29_07835 [Methylovirgula sp.]